MCGQIADLELSWMPGMYAATNKVYMGTASDGLTLLADVAGDSNVIVQELKRDTTYYWRVDGTDANGKVTTGDVWSFNTGKLVGWWKFDESTGTTAYDSSGNGNNGTLKGNPVWRPTGGVSGGAIELSGKGDYVEISNESAFDINEPDNDFCLGKYNGRPAGMDRHCYQGRFGMAIVNLFRQKHLSLRCFQQCLS